MYELVLYRLTLCLGNQEEIKHEKYELLLKYSFGRTGKNAAEDTGRCNKNGYKKSKKTVLRTAKNVTKGSRKREKKGTI